MSRFATLIILLISFASIQAAEPREQPVTKSYGVADLLHRVGKTGFDSADEITRMIIETVSPKSWQLNGGTAYRLFVVNCTRLEINASKQDHDDIAELLEALRRLNDLAVDVKTTFYSVDAKWFDKEMRPKLDKKGAWVIDELWATIREHAEVVQSGKVRLGNGRIGSIAALHQVFSFIKPEPSANGQPVWGAERIGVEYRLKPIVSADRRFVKLDIDEVLRLLAMPTKGELTMRIEEKKRPSTHEIGDGASIALAVPYQPGAIKAKGRILILYVELQLFIGAEEKVRRGIKDDG